MTNSHKLAIQTFCKEILRSVPNHEKDKVFMRLPVNRLRPVQALQMGMHIGQREIADRILHLLNAIERIRP